MIRSVLALSILLAPLALIAQQMMQEHASPPLPEPVSNNAVASLDLGDGNYYLVSFSGLGPGKTHSDTHSKTWVWRTGWKAWKQGPDVPDGAGRLASIAATANGRVWVFGGYTVAADDSEVSTPWVHAFDPVTMTFEEAPAMPVPVDDTVAAVYEDRYIYLISGWHDYGNVNLVQRFDTETLAWSQATPTPGPGVFGHAGGIVDNKILYCDGVAIEPHADRSRDFKAVDNCYLGIIDEDNSRRIDWRVLPPHPGLPRYRMAATGAGDSVWFFGGSENPYNYNGIGYDGKPSVPAVDALVYHLPSGMWGKMRFAGTPTMDHRGLLRGGASLVTIGGMVDGQVVIPDVFAYDVMGIAD